MTRGRVEIAGAAALEDSGAVLSEALTNLAPRLLNGATRAEAGADLGNDLSMAAGDHVLIDRIEQETASAGAGGLDRVTFRVDVESDLQGMTAFLTVLARGPAALVVNELRLVTRDPASGDDRPETLTGELRVAGWYLPAGDSAHQTSGAGR